MPETTPAPPAASAETSPEQPLSADIALLDEIPDDIPADEPTPKPAPKEEPEPEAEPVTSEEEPEEPEEERAETDKDKEPRIRQIAKEYPELFKKHPELRAAWYEAREARKLFPSVEDMKDAATDAEALRDLENSLLRGEPGLIIDAVGHSSPEALKAVVRNFLPALEKRSKDLYIEAVTPAIKSLLATARRAARESGDSNLLASTQHLARFVFHTEKGEIPEDKAPSADPEKLALQRELAMRDQQTLSKFESATHTEALGKLRAEVARTVDPEKAFSEFVRTALIDRILNDVGEALEKDQEHMTRMNSLWARAKRAGGEDSWRSRIVAAYLERGRQLLPSIRARRRTEALEGQPDSTQAGKRGVVVPPSQGAPGKGGKPISSKDVDYSRTSDMDIMEDEGGDKITPKKRR